MLIVGGITRALEVKSIIQLEFHGVVITTSTEGIPSTLNWQRPLLNLVEIIVTNIFIFCVILITCVCSSNGQIRISIWALWCHHYRWHRFTGWLQQWTCSSKREHTYRVSKNKSTDQIDNLYYQFRRRCHFLNLNSVDDTETAMIMVMVADLYRQKNWNINLPRNYGDSMSLLTLLFVWQHVALMHPSSVVGQSNAQPSCDPFAFKLFDNPSAWEKKIKIILKFARCLRKNSKCNFHLKCYSDSRAPETLAELSSNECPHCGKIPWLFRQFSCIRKDFCIECVPTQ